jgi:hypothetical protein
VFKKYSVVKLFEINKIFFIVKYFLFPAFSLLLLYQMLFEVEPVIHGDGFEYTFMTESFYNHFSPELTRQDLNTFKENLVNAGRYIDWNAQVVNTLMNHLSDKKFLSSSYGYFTDLSGVKYSYHFFFYSILNLPMRFILDIFHGNLEYMFPLTNLIILAFTCFYLLFKSNLPPVKLIFIALFFTFSSVFWFLPFSGPEVFANCMCILSLVLFYEKKYYLSVLLASIASTHYPPIILIAIFVSIKSLLDNKFTFKNISLLFLSGLPSLIPTLFYYYHFKIPNLILHSGYISKNLFSFTRLFGIFFDLNQGMVLAIPVLIFIFFIIYFKTLLKGRKFWNYDLLLLPVVLGMISFFINMFYWNNGYSILRYATWCCVPLIIFTIMNSDFSIKWIRSVFVIALLIHILNIYNVFNSYKLGGLQVKGWQGSIHTNLAEWVIENYPNLYNPDPDIFGQRTLWGKIPSPSDSPICYYNKAGKLCKAMVHKTKINELNPDIFNKNKIEDLNFINDWAYINF